jgi:alpha-beta hydrolase superfamily lysophospholipase
MTAASPAPAQTARVALPGGDHIVLDWTAPAGGCRQAAVFIHGLGSHRRGEKSLHFAQRFAALGWGYLALDLRGHGESSATLGELSLTRCLEDLAAALAWLPADAHPALLIGSSMGGAVAAWHRLRHPDPAGLTALIAPSLGFPHGWAEALDPAELDAWRRTGRRRFRSEWLDVEIGWHLMEDARRYDPALLAREWTSPALILHGMRDSAVDWRASVRFAETCACPRVSLLLMKDGDHRLTAERGYLFDAMRAWLVREGAADVTVPHGGE